MEDNKIIPEFYRDAEFDLQLFFGYSWSILEPETPILFNWHHELIIEHLTACYTREIKRLIINIPPRYAKSSLVSVCFPAWAWISQPHLRFMFSSYSQSLSTKHSVDRRTVIESDWYQRGWSDKFSLAKDQNVKTEFQNDKRGVMIGTSMHGSATGKGANFIVIDDPHNPKGAESEVQRQSVLDAFDRTFSNRLNNKDKDVIILVSQRLHEKDLTGHLLEKGGWEHLKIPGVEPTKKTYIFPITQKTITRETGSLLHEDRENDVQIQVQKKALGSYGFSGQYQQDPAPMGGGLIQTKWFKTYKALPDRFDEVIMSWDLAFKESDDSDYVVGEVWGRRCADKYLLDVSRARMDFVQTLVAFKDLCAKWPKAYAKLVEEKANGAALINTLKHHISGIIPIVPKESKVARVQAVCPEIEAGNIYLPEHATWLEEFLHECASFPKGAHDDLVDGMSQALNWFQHTRSGDWLDSPDKSSKSMVSDIISDTDNW